MSELLTTSEVKNIRIAIIGGGLGGLMLARMLHLKGLEFTIFEQDGHSSERSYGGTLDLHEDTGLFAIHQAGLFEMFKTIARYEDQGLRLLNKEAHLLFESHEGNRPEIDRGQLRELLLGSVPTDSIRWGHALVEARPIDSEGFELVFQNGVTDRFDFVVGAYGSWSRVRPLVSADRPKYTGLTFFEMTIQDVDTQHPEIAEFINRGLTIATADRKLLMAQRNASGHVRAYAALRVPEETDGQDGRYQTVRALKRSEIRSEYECWNSSLTNLIDSAEDAVRPWPINSLPVGHSWQTMSGVTLLGDAAHLMPPAGDGANLAMRDGVDLAFALADEKNWKSAVESYEAAICERAEAAAKQAMAVLVEGSSQDSIESIEKMMTPGEAEGVV